MPADLPQRLRARLDKTLPGRSAHRGMTPELAFGRHAGPPAFDARGAAVVAMLYRDRERWCLLLTVRAEHLSTHAGQVSLPGGMSEPGERPEQTASRELQEELGIAERGLEFLGRLSPVYVFNSNFSVTPCVAWTAERLEIAPNPREVAKVLEAPLAELADPKHHGSHWIERQGLRFKAPHIAWQGERIWGATCLILAELLAVVGEATA